MLSGADVAKHSAQEDCWVIIHGKAYDVTDFLPMHPGGAHIILKYAGRDATAEFDPIHPADTLTNYLPADKLMGAVDMTTLSAGQSASSGGDGDGDNDEEEAARQRAVAEKPLLEQCYNLFDFEAVARRVMTRTAWGYYSSGADDEMAMRENHAAFHRVWFRPRVLVDVEKVDTATTMLGAHCAAPFYVTATALGKLGHPEGETVLTRAAGRHGIVQMLPTLASCSLDEMVDAATDAQTQWFQLYVNKDRAVTRRIVEHAERRGCRGLFITVDAPQLGRREKDMRTKFRDPGPDVACTAATFQGAARAISTFIDPALSWSDLPFFQSITAMPIVLKGVQRAADVLLAAEHGLAGVVLSNHGGRQLDFAPPALELLAEVMPLLRERDLGGRRFEVFIDGGVRRATDIVKALCLGARGVGIGRPFLYAMSSYGLAGVDRAMQLLKDEMEMTMRLLGATCVADLTPDLVDARGLFRRSASLPSDRLAEAVYEPLVNPPQRVMRGLKNKARL